jgi:hypothetical protein
MGLPTGRAPDGTAGARVPGPADTSAGIAVEAAGQPTGLLRATGARLVVGAVLVFIVVLLSVIFSFLGTLTCSVLIGMMMGSARGSRWWAVPVSLLFAAVTLAMFLFPEPSVPVQKAISLSLLCFASFWATYLVTYGVIALEGRGNPAPDRAQDENLRAAPVPASNRIPGDQRASETTSGIGHSAVDADLEALQGKWVAQPDTAAGRESAEAIDINRDRFRFERIDSHGRVALAWEGTVRCESLGPFKAMTLSHLSFCAPANPVGNGEETRTWIYCLAARTLSIVSHRDRNGRDRPQVDQYSRVEG